MNIEIKDPLESTQRLPIVGGVCNCPTKEVVVHLLECPLRPQFMYLVNGRQLSELGLDGATVVHPGGHTEPLIGIYFHLWDSKISMYENLRLAFGQQYPGCKLVFGPL